MIDVSVILTNYKTAELCVNAVNSIIEKTECINYEIIVVDNDSPDDSMRILQEKLPSSVVLKKTDYNLGFGKANNFGMALAKGEYYFLLNTDTLLVNNAIKILYDYIKDKPYVGVVGGNLFDFNNNPVHSFKKKLPSIKDFRIMTSFFEALKFKFTKKLSDFNYTDLPLEVGYITGADMMIRKNVLDEVGKFDKDFFMYAEECELSFRISKAGYKIFSIPQAHIIHYEGASFDNKTTKKEFNAIRYKTFLEGNMLYYQKVYGEKYVSKYLKTLLKNIRFWCFFNKIRARATEQHKEQIKVIEQIQKEKIEVL